MTAPYKIYAPETRRQLSQMDLLASPSRTGGHAADEDALLSYAVQEQFREHIEVKVSFDTYRPPQVCRRWLTADHVDPLTAARQPAVALWRRLGRQLGQAPHH